MLIVISPAKTLDFQTPPITDHYTQPEWLNRSSQLIERLRQLSTTELAEMMKLSDKLATLNHQRYRDWHQPFTSDNAKQAVLAMKGDVYGGLDAESMSEASLAFAQSHLRILSGLYGILRPLDLIQPYRLEMGTRLPTKAGNNLYQFWGDTITDALDQAMDDSAGAPLINLASTEYFKSVRLKRLNANVITPQFKERKGDRYRVIGIHAKKARGLMSRYIITNRLTEVEAIKTFNLNGYAFHPEQSSEKEWAFCRG